MYVNQITCGLVCRCVCVCVRSLQNYQIKFGRRPRRPNEHNVNQCSRISPGKIIASCFPSSQCFLASQIQLFVFRVFILIPYSARKCAMLANVFVSIVFIDSDVRALTKWEIKQIYGPICHNTLVEVRAFNYE